MPIPNANLAYIPPEKLVDYLLNLHHPVGGCKASWFHRVGYQSTKPEVLEQDLLHLVQISEDFSEKASAFGTKYVVNGRITTPLGKEKDLTTVWIVEPSDPRPRLVTAYPGE